MVFKLYLLSILLTLPLIFFSQKGIEKPTEINPINFIQDTDNSIYYNLSITTETKDLFGTINFYTEKGRVFYQMYEVELTFHPAYHSIDVSEFPKGEITIEVFIDDKPFLKKIRL